MSFKGKDLHYNDKQPAFLRRLRGEITGDGSGRHEQPIPRNKRLKKDDDEDDAPTYVLEDTNQSMTKAEYEAMVASKDAEKREDATNGEGEATKDQATTQPKDNIAEVGKVAKKRKAAKVIAEEKGEEAQELKEPDKKVVKKAKRKGKPVKLSFGDEEGD